MTKFLEISIPVALSLLVACGEKEPSRAKAPEAPAVRALFGKIRDAIPPAGTLPPCAGKADASWPMITWRGLNLVAEGKPLDGIDAPASPPPELDPHTNPPGIDHIGVRDVDDYFMTTAGRSRTAKELLSAPGFLVTRVDQARLPLVTSSETGFLGGEVHGRLLRVGSDGRATCETPFNVTSSDHIQTEILDRNKTTEWLQAAAVSDLSQRTSAAILQAAGR